ncbi:hypothetical protein RFI_03603, partial [Reticulomyxa filosa]
MVDLAEWLYFGWLFVTAVGVLPYVTWCIVAYKKRKRHSFIHKRRPMLVVLIIIASLIYLTGKHSNIKKIRTHTYTTMCMMKHIREQKKKVIRTLSAIMVIYPWLNKEGRVKRYIVNVCSGSGVMVIEWVLIRIWLLYYDFTRDIHQLDIRWQRHIISVNYIPWTMKYEFLGNFNILFVASFPIFIAIEGIIMALTDTLKTSAWMYVITATGLVFVSIGMYPVLQIQQVRDVMEVKDNTKNIYARTYMIGEIRRLLICTVILMIIYGTGLLIFGYYWILFANIVEIWTCYMASIAMVCLSYICLHRVVQFVDMYEKNRILAKLKRQGKPTHLLIGEESTTTTMTTTTATAGTGTAT